MSQYTQILLSLYFLFKIEATFFVVEMDILYLLSQPSASLSEKIHLATAL